MNRVIGIIQARMSSSRLPSKTLLPIHGRPMLMRVWDRLRLCQRLDEIVVATSNHPSNDMLAKVCEREIGMSYERAADNDYAVTTRLRTVADRWKADAIVRVTPDCPLLDPDLVDETVRLAVYQKAQYGSNVFPRTFPDGLDVEFLTRECLEGLPESEEPTRYIWEYPERFRIASVKHVEDLSRLNWTVNYMDDLEFVRWIYERLPEGFGWRDVLALSSHGMRLDFVQRLPEPKLIISPQ